MNNKKIIRHYDALIDIDNDPVKDPKELKEYMDKWDGQSFIDKMHLSKDKSVLEIGVGTGRLAIKIAPKAKEFFGIDLSLKTILRAKENLREFNNVNLVCGDFLKYDFNKKFDVIYSSLTFMHIKNKKRAIKNTYNLLNYDGKFILSLDKSKNKFIDAGISKIKVFFSDEKKIMQYMKDVGFSLEEFFQTEFANIIIAKKEIGK